MAKAKKTQAAPPAGEPKNKKASGKKAAKTVAPAQPVAPMIDTKLAAAAAAKLVAHKDDIAAASESKSESAAFKEMKENLHKPVGGSTPSFLQTPSLGKKFNNAVPGRNQQLGRNQTFGADVNRSGVPRRTGGG